ncbi:MAG: hypothetical protein D3910_21005 [Candidatus Electrothrix sp. ATG2]|nr:hypothetical protein [Candidatus Electrothrix sp. ATG2]
MESLQCSESSTPRYYCQEKLKEVSGNAQRIFFSGEDKQERVGCQRFFREVRFLKNWYRTGTNSVSTKKGLSLKQAKSLYILVGREGFEPSTN